jgi:hemerythrin
MIQFVQWTHELSVGVEEIDEQHKVLIKIINEMHEAIRLLRSKETVGEILGRLIEYTRIHFAVEESLMRILNYPGYEDHKAQHEELLIGVFDLKKKLADGKAAVGFELMHFLKRWLTKHIMESDHQYSEHFLSAGANAKLKNRSWISRLWE